MSCSRQRERHRPCGGGAEAPHNTRRARRLNCAQERSRVQLGLELAQSRKRRGLARELSRDWGGAAVASGSELPGLKSRAHADKRGKPLRGCACRSHRPCHPSRLDTTLSSTRTKRPTGGMGGPRLSRRAQVWGRSGTGGAPRPTVARPRPAAFGTGRPSRPTCSMAVLGAIRVPLPAKGRPCRRQSCMLC